MKSESHDDKSAPIRRKRVRGNKFVTKSGATIKIHRTLTEKSIARREAKMARKASRLKGLPKSRVKRFFWRMHPKRVLKFWFSRDGLILGLKLAGITIVFGFFSLMALFAYFRKDLPSLKDISGSNKGGSVRYYDKTGLTLLWEDYDAVKRVPVTDDNISQFMKDATVAIEDREFFNHGGFDTKGILRAAYNNAVGGSTQGGSTITQQLVKLTTPGFDQDRSVTRKVKELILSVEMERSYTKKQILNAYLNVAPYGGIEYGVEVGAQTYFHKSAKDVSLEEAAFLASIPKSPVYYSPYNSLFDKSRLKARTDYVLDIMFDTGKITKEQRDAAKKVDVAATVFFRVNKYTGIKAPYFVLAAKEQLENLISVNGYLQGGLKVITTLDMDLQAEAERQVAAEIPAIRKNINPVQPITKVRNADAPNGAKAAITAEDVKTGQVVAMVGGPDFFDDAHGGQTNFARTRLAPGSSFKPYDYSALIENTTNIGAGAVLYDSKGPVANYICTKPGLGRTTPGADCLYDYDSRFPGALPIRYSLGGSRNVPAVKAYTIATRDKVIETAEKMGLKSGYKCYADDTKETEQECYSAAAIGDGAYLYQDEHVHSYATLARNGVNLPQTYILKTIDSRGKEGNVWKLSQGTQAIKDETAYIVSDILKDGNASYFPSGRKPHNGVNGNKFAMKTGSTNDSKDGWMMGFSSHYAVGVWIGHYTSQYEFYSCGSCTPLENMTQPIWQGFMTYANKNLPAETQPRPAGIQELPAYVVGGKFSSAGGEVVPSRKTDLYPSWYKRPSVKPGEKQIYDKVSGKLATDCTPDLAKEERSNALAASFSGDTFVTGSGGTGQEKDDVHKCEDIKPSITLTVSETTTPGVYSLNSTVTQGTYAMSDDKFKGAVTFKVNGQVIDGGSLSIDNPGVLPTITYKSTSAGPKTISVEVSDSKLYSGSFSLENQASVMYTPGSP